MIAHSALQGIPRSSSASLRSFLEKLWLIHTQREFNLHLEMQMYLKSEQAGQVEQTDSFRVLFSLVFFLNWMPFVGKPKRETGQLHFPRRIRLPVKPRRNTRFFPPLKSNVKHTLVVVDVVVDVVEVG